VANVSLVARAARGDRTAFDVLVEASIDRLYAVARLILRDADLSEDAVQEALVHCWQRLPTLRDSANFDAWLYRLVVNAAIDESRDRRRFRTAVTELPVRWLGTDPSVELAERDRLARGFERLRVEHRVVLVLHYYVGMTTTEIGSVLGIPGGTAKSRLHYAIEAMRAGLEADARAASTKLGNS
jgi:RNA polymerase sigma-70 factor (ECF subfamily)